MKSETKSKFSTERPEAINSAVAAPPFLLENSNSTLNRVDQSTRTDCMFDGVEDVNKKVSSCFCGAMCLQGSKVVLAVYVCVIRYYCQTYAFICLYYLCNYKLSR